MLFTNQPREHLSGASPLMPAPADAEVRKLTKEGDICVSDILCVALDAEGERVSLHLIRSAPDGGSRAPCSGMCPGRP